MRGLAEPTPPLPPTDTPPPIDPTFSINADSARFFLPKVRHWLYGKNNKILYEEEVGETDEVLAWAREKRGNSSVSSLFSPYSAARPLIDYFDSPPIATCRFYTTCSTRCYFRPPSFIVIIISLFSKKKILTSIINYSLSCWRFDTLLAIPTCYKVGVALKMVQKFHFSHNSPFQFILAHKKKKRKE